MKPILIAVLLASALAYLTDGAAGRGAAGQADSVSSASRDAGSPGIARRSIGQDDGAASAVAPSAVLRH